MVQSALDNRITYITRMFYPTVSCCLGMWLTCSMFRIMCILQQWQVSIKLRSFPLEILGLPFDRCLLYRLVDVFWWCLAGCCGTSIRSSWGSLQYCVWLCACYMWSCGLLSEVSWTKASKIGLDCIVSSNHRSWHTIAIPDTTYSSSFWSIARMLGPTDNLASIEGHRKHNISF